MKPRMVAVKPSELVILAIHNLEEKNGSSPQDIVKFISTQYGIESDQVKKHVEDALQRGIQFGILAEREGRYSLEEVPQPPADSKSTSSQKIPVEKKSSSEVEGRRRSLRKKPAQKRKPNDDDGESDQPAAKKSKKAPTKRKGRKRVTKKEDEPPKPHRRSLRQR